MLTDIFSSADVPFVVWAYGSRVSGESCSGSDLDLVCRTPDGKPLPADTFLMLTEKIQDSNIPFLVDFFDWARLPESFHRNIEKQYEVLFPTEHSEK
jgi:predicted nucleotidyltransferase